MVKLPTDSAPEFPPLFSSLLPPETHARLHSLVELELGQYAVTVQVMDAGSPALGSFSQINVTVCACDSFSQCRSETAAMLGSSVGISFIALIIVMAAIALLLCESLGKVVFMSLCPSSKAKKMENKFLLG